MSSYETLLENYNIEEKYANDSFSNMMACFESLNAFANEDVNFEVTISLEEAKSGKIKDNLTKIKEGAKRTAAALEKKVSEFIAKIKDALSRFVAKAKITVADKGSKALKKMLGNSELIIGKDIKLKTFKDNKSNAAIFDQVYDTIDKITNTSVFSTSIFSHDEDGLNDAKSVVNALGDDVSKSNIVEETVLKASDNMKVKDAFEKYVDPLLADTTDNLSNVQEFTNETIKNLKKSINWYKKKNKDIDKDSSIGVGDKVADKLIYSKQMYREREVISLYMKISTRYMNYVGTVLVMAASNASKIALAAVDAKGKSVAAKFSKKEK